MHVCLDTRQWVCLCRVHIVTHVDSTFREVDPRHPAVRREKFRKAKMWAGRAILGRGNRARPHRWEGRTPTTLSLFELAKAKVLGPGSLACMSEQG